MEIMQKLKNRGIMKNKTQFILLLLVVAIGCATTKNYENSLNEWVGKDIKAYPPFSG